MIDIIIVNYNSTDCVLGCLKSIRQCDNIDIIKNVVVVDNNSSDSPETIKRFYPNIVLLRNEKNEGFSAAVNTAFEYCLSQYTMLLNPDTIVEHDLFSSIIDYLQKNKDVGALGPKVYDDDGKIQGSARSFPTPLTSLFGRNSLLTRLFPSNKISASNILNLNDDIENPVEVDWISGACLVLRRDLIDMIGYLDERFYIYWEDADLCQRIRNVGFKVVYFTGAKIYHSVGKSSSQNPFFSTYHFHRSCYRLFDKYSKLPTRILLPFAFYGLTLRCLFVIVYQFMCRRLKRDEQLRIEDQIHIKKDKIKILRIISRMNIGGPALHVKNLTVDIDKNKYDTMLITGSISLNEGDMSYLIKNEKIKKRLIPELQREISPINDFISIIKIVKWIVRYKPDIVDTHTSKAGTISRAAVLLSKFFIGKKIKCIHTFHGHVFHGYFNEAKTKLIILIEKFFSRITDKIIALSQTQKWELSEKYKIAKENKICEVNLGFDLVPFLQSKKLKGQLRQRYNLDSETIIVGIVGRLTSIKNQKFFLDAANIFLRQLYTKPAIFIVVGDGEKRECLERYARKIGIHDKVKFYGWEKNIPKIYADLDILALTSLNEGTPVSIIEAMASSVPVITTGVGGVKDLLGEFLTDTNNTKGYNVCERGILCDDNNPNNFAKGLLYMVTNGFLTNTERISNARNYVFENYSLERLIKEMEKLYDSLVKC